ncbi:hypothetical protein FHG87_025299 [Trinorchestia longiramus]|nr:hypothetical protein FHG87_025299 [Trinorchestia longiramus]
MEYNQNTEKATKAKTRYCKECKATYSLQLFNIRGCNMDECRFCYFKQESAAIIGKQSRTIQELSCQLELNRQLELSCHLELNRQINLLTGRLATIETNQKQHYEHEPRLQSPETQLKQHLPTNNQPQHIKIIAKRQEIIAKRPNFYLKTKNCFSTLKDEMESNALKNEIYPTWKRKEQCIRHKQAKKLTALSTNQYHLTSPLQQTSLALQETLAKPQNYWQPDHDHWDTLNKTALSQHDNRLGQLKILVGNVQSLLPKMSELEAIASTLSHDIIAVNEIWLDLNGRHLPAEVSIKGYVLCNVDKPSHSSRGGGSLIYVKEKL